MFSTRPRPSFSLSLSVSLRCPNAGKLPKVAPTKEESAERAALLGTDRLSEVEHTRVARDLRAVPAVQRPAGSLTVTVRTV